MINISLSCLTNNAKHGWCLIAQELLQEEHNIMGDWYNPIKPLILEATYQKLRAQVQIAFPYDGNKLTEVDWKRYQVDRFDKKNKLILAEKDKYLALLRENKPFSVNLDDDIAIN